MNPDLLTLTQWLSPAFPVGGFAYSHGLEQVIAAGEVADAAGLRAWLRVGLEEGAGAVGIAARRLSLSAPQVAAFYLHGFASNLVSAAVRFVPLGQTEGQRVLQALHAPITAIAARAAEATLDDIGTAALGADLAAMRHETMDVRIFKT